MVTPNHRPGCGQKPNFTLRPESGVALNPAENATRYWDDTWSLCSLGSAERKMVRDAGSWEAPTRFPEPAGRRRASPLGRRPGLASTTIAPGVEGTEALAEWPVRSLTSWPQRKAEVRLRGDLLLENVDGYVRILFSIFEPPGDRNCVENLRSRHESSLRSGRRPHRLMDLVGVGLDQNDSLHGGTCVRRADDTTHLRRPILARITFTGVGDETQRSTTVAKHRWRLDLQLTIDHRSGNAELL